MALEDTVPTREEIFDLISKMNPPAPGLSRTGRNDRKITAIRNFLQAKGVDPKAINAIISDLPSYSFWEHPERTRPREN